MSTSTAPPNPLDAKEKRATLTQITWRIVPLIFVGYTLNYIDRVNLGFAQLGMGAELGISTAAYGLAAAVFFIAYVIFEVPSNILLEKFGARRWLARIMISWGLVTVLTGFVTNVHMLYVMRFLLGFAEAGFWPGLVLYLTKWFLVRERVVALGWLILAQPIAFILGSIVGGVILDHSDWLGLSPWQWIFILTGAPTILVGLATWRLLPDSPHTASWLSNKRRDWLKTSLAAEGSQEQNHDHSVRGQLAAFKNRNVAWLSVTLMMFGIGFYGFNLFVPLIVRQINPEYSATNIGLVAAVPYVCAAVGVLLFSRMGRTPRRLRAVATGLALVFAAGLVGVIVFRGEPNMALVALCVAAVGCISFLPPFWAMTTAGLSKTHAVVGIAVINSMANVGGFIGPYLVGRAAEGETVTGGLLIPVAAMLICALMLVTWRDRTVSSRAASS